MDMIHSRGRRRFLAVAAASVAASAIETSYAVDFRQKLTQFVHLKLTHP